MNATLKTPTSRIITSLALALLLTTVSTASSAEPPQGAAAPTGPASTAAPAAGPSNTTTAPAGPASDAAVAQPTAATAEPQKVVCRDEKVTGSKLRSRKVCSTPDSESKSGDWVREQQARGGIGASAIVNGQ
jgi:hypothetical protein